MKAILDRMGYKVIRKDLDEVVLFEDMHRFLPGDMPLTVFDVGAMLGKPLIGSCVIAHGRRCTLLSKALAAMSY